MIEVTPEFLETLKALAQEYKTQQKEFIDSMDGQTLRLLDKDTEMSVSLAHQLRTAMDYIEDRYETMRIINWFVEFAETFEYIPETIDQ